MGSPAGKRVCGKYVGDGTADVKEVKPGFAPSYIKVWSANGSVEKPDVTPQSAKRDAAGALTFIDGISLSEFGFEISSTDAALNASGVEYYWMAEG